MDGEDSTNVKRISFRRSSYMNRHDITTDSSMVYQPTTESVLDNSDSSDGVNNGLRPRSRLVAAYGSLAILCFVNLINYMDRFTVAGVLKSIGDYYSLSHDELGLLQTCFIISYMIFAPAFGYLGDRFSRKYLMAIGITFWSITTLAGSFVPANRAWLFYGARALVGIGEASYSTLAPTVIADLFPRGQRTTMLSVFYFAIPVGSGLGYAVGTQVAAAFHGWQWALRVTPPLGLASVLFIIFILHEPERGSSDGHVTTSDRSPFIKDLKYAFSVPTYVWTTVGFTCVCFTIGALSWWAPYYMLHAYKIHDPHTTQTEDSVGLIFGAITCLAGILGVIIGSGGAAWYRKHNPSADPIVCAIGMFIGVPFTFIGFITAHDVPAFSWFMLSLGVTSLCTNWALVADILMYVIVPNKRATAQSIQILASHLLGDATSPVIIGALSRRFGGGSLTGGTANDETAGAYFGLMYAFFVSLFVLVIGGVAFLYSSKFLVRDVERCKANAAVNAAESNNNDELAPKK